MISLFLHRFISGFYFAEIHKFAEIKLSNRHALQLVDVCTHRAPACQSCQSCSETLEC